MADTPLSIGIALATVMVVAAANDLRTRRIPNAITLAGVLAAPVLWGLAGGPSMALGSVVGGALALVVGMTLFAMGAVGGGDAKLLVVTGAFLGPSRLVVALVIIGITGGAIALVVAFARGRLMAALAGAWHLSVHLTTLGHKGTSRDVASPGAMTIPYGVAIAAGSVVTWYVYASLLAP
jgi:prepilin peptidase CpaA